MNIASLSYGAFPFAEFIVRICSEKKENAVLLLQTYLPLLKPGSVEAKKAYMDMIPKVNPHSVLSTNTLDWCVCVSFR